MKDFLKNEKEAYEKRWSDFLKETSIVLNKIRNEIDYEFDVIVNYSADDWLEGRNSEVVISCKDKKKVEERLRFNYFQSDYNYDEDNAENEKIEIIRAKLLEYGVLTPSWFSVLTLCRNYDCVIRFSKKGSIIVDDHSSFYERRVSEHRWNKSEE